MTTSQIEVYQLLKAKIGEREAEKVVTFITELSEKNVQTAASNLLTKEDKIDILNRMDAHFKWLVGIMLTAISIAVAVAKLI